MEGSGGALGSGAFFFGGTTNVHGGGIDQPLVAIRHEYSDSLTFAARIFPQTNYRGQYDGGTGNACVTINQQSANPLPTHPEWEFPNAEPTPPNNPADGGGTVQHCVVVDWPGKTLWPTMERKSRWYYPESWSGSLLMHSRDPSGQYYRRNRFYDGASGRFTQEDPIGIAGGLNVYGYAAGDPITYSDPFGLCPPKFLCDIIGATAGEAATQHWAEVANDNSGLTRALATGAGLFSALWTPDTYGATGATLMAGAGAGAALGAASAPAAAPTAARTLASRGPTLRLPPG